MCVWFLLPVVIFAAVIAITRNQRFRRRTIVLPALYGWIATAFLLLAANTFLAYVSLGFDDLKPNGDYLIASLFLALAAITFLVGSSQGYVKARTAAENSKT
jgi:cobalamin biosynthesis protein CobD/CbiB